MKARHYLIAFGVSTVAVVLLISLLMKKPAPKNQAITTPMQGSAVRITDQTKPHPKPTKFFQFNHQPTGPEEIAIWDWWFYMDKHDPEFQWKTPLNFYGRVIDQHGLPVAGARVALEWTNLDGVPKRNRTTDQDGRFTLSGETGKRLSVNIGADGYKGGSSSNQSFEYSAFWEPIYHVPNKDSPVLFRLWKLENAEPMYFWDGYQRMSVDGHKFWFDTKTGKFGSTGDIAFSTRRGATYGPRQFDWTLTVDAAPGSGIAVRNEELMFEAPDAGDSPAHRVFAARSEATWACSRRSTHRYFLAAGVIVNFIRSVLRSNSTSYSCPAFISPNA